MIFNAWYGHFFQIWFNHTTMKSYEIDPRSEWSMWMWPRVRSRWRLPSPPSRPFRFMAPRSIWPQGNRRFVKVCFATGVGSYLSISAMLEAADVLKHCFAPLKLSILSYILV